MVIPSQMVQGKWAMLKEETANRVVLLEAAMDPYLFFSDCNESSPLSVICLVSLICCEIALLNFDC